MEKLGDENKKIRKYENVDKFELNNTSVINNCVFALKNNQDRFTVKKMKK
jgi:hypothetical protein